MFSFWHNYESWLRACLHTGPCCTDVQQKHQWWSAGNRLINAMFAVSYCHDLIFMITRKIQALIYLLTPISRARSEPSRRMMLQGRAFLLYFPGRVFLPVVGFWSARPLTFRRLKNLSILAHTGVTSRVTKVQHITIFISSWFLVWSGPVFLPLQPKHISEIGVYNDLPDLTVTVSLVTSPSNTITIDLTRPS